MATIEEKPAKKAAKKATAARKPAADRTPLRRDPVTSELVETPPVAPQNGASAPESNGHGPYDPLMSGRQRARLDTSNVRKYLETLDKPKVTAGKLTPEYIDRKIPELEELLARPDLDVIERLKSTQLLKDLLAKQAKLRERGDAEAVEAAFIECAARWSEREGISWSAWRSMKIPAEVLKRADIAETRQPRS